MSMSPMHPDALRLMEMVRASGRPGFETMTPAEARAAYAAGRAVLQPPAEEVASVRDLTIPGPVTPIPLRIYRGAGTADGTVLDCLLYLHGGGWVVGDLESHDGVCRRLANLAGCVVVAVDYRLAPENVFPAAVEDAAAALQWIAENAESIGTDRRRLAVGGDSAGGNLAAVLALMGRDGAVPATLFQLLFYPATDFAMSTKSYQQVTQDVPLTAATMHWFADHYVPTPGARLVWQASPALAASLAGTPPALVLTVGHDPLADEGVAYAQRLEREGVRVTALHLSDQPHGILTMGQVIGATEMVLKLAAAALRDAFRTA
jgi:acetyl esterase